MYSRIPKKSWFSVSLTALMIVGSISVIGMSRTPTASAHVASTDAAVLAGTNVSQDNNPSLATLGCDSNNPNEWHWVITQRDAAGPPDHIHVKFTVAGWLSIPLGLPNSGGVAHYRIQTTSIPPGDTPIVAPSGTTNPNARVQIDNLAWNGNFVLSHGPCATTDPCPTIQKTFAVTSAGKTLTSYTNLTDGTWTMNAVYQLYTTAAGATTLGAPVTVPLAVTADGLVPGSLTLSATVPIPNGSFLNWKVTVPGAGYDSGFLLTSPETIAPSAPAVCTMSNTTVSQVTQVTVIKQEDTDANSILGLLEPLLGNWAITATSGTETIGPLLTDGITGAVSFDLDPLLTWTISETLQSGWGQTFPLTGTHTWTNGSPTTLRFGNAHPAAKIELTPLKAVNEVNSPHQITATVSKKAGSALPFSAAAGVTVTFTLTNNTALAAFVGGFNTCITDVILGQCAVSINTTTAGGVDIGASATVAVGPYVGPNVQIPVSTDGTGGSSNPVHKSYVDASISIASDGVNAVGQQHVFTITVTAYPGDAAPISFGAITPNVSPAPTSQNDTCGNPTINGNVATCTLTINSTAAGVFVANASASVTMGGVAVTRDTYPAPNTIPAGPGGSGPATKRYVDASITIASDAVNAVGQLHVFTITVTAYPSGATPVSFGAITPSVSPAPTSQSSTCGAPAGSGNVRTCTLTINSTTAGIFVANASASVTMGGVTGVTVTRDTDPATTTIPAGLNGSGPATKRYVDASIAITPGQATNLVGQPHVFTITVTAYPSGTGTPSAVTVTPTISPATPMNTTCGDPFTWVINSGVYVTTCTVSINSGVEATFTLNATTTVTMGGVAVTRDTSPSTTTIPAGPGGSGPATKLYVSQGCSPGFWKNNTGRWDGPTPVADYADFYMPGDVFMTVFGTGLTLADVNNTGSTAITSSTTLLQVLNLGGGSKIALARAAVSALLNADATPPLINVDSRFDTASEVIAFYQASVLGDPAAGLAQLAYWETNEVCPLSAAPRPRPVSTEPSTPGAVTR